MKTVQFTGQIMKEDKPGGWTFVTWPDSAIFLGTGKATKVTAKIEDHECAVTCLPTGDGTHFLPLNKAVLKATSKTIGDTISIEVWTLQ